MKTTILALAALLGLAVFSNADHQLRAVGRGVVVVRTPQRVVVGGHSPVLRTVVNRQVVVGRNFGYGTYGGVQRSLGYGYAAQATYAPALAAYAAPPVEAAPVEYKAPVVVPQQQVVQAQAVVTAPPVVYAAYQVQTVLAVPQVTTYAVPVAAPVAAAVYQAPLSVPYYSFSYGHYGRSYRR